MGRRWILAVLMAMGVPWGAAMAADAAADYPTRPIRLIVPTGAGAITDLLARAVAEPLGQSLGQSVVVENRPGASGIIGSGQVAKAEPDGHTLLMVFPSHVVNMFLFKNVPYDTVRDFAPVSRVGLVSQLMLVHPDSPFRTVQAFIDHAKAHPGSLNFGSVGQGTLAHLTTQRLAAETGIDLVHVPYKSGSQMEVALMSRELDVIFLSPLTTLQLVKAGKMRALAVADAERLPILPDVPTLSEAGVPGFVMQGWNGILAPAGTPRPIIEKLNREINRILGAPATRERFLAQGVMLVPGSTDEFASIIQRDIDTNGRLIRDAGIQPE